MLRSAILAFALGLLLLHPATAQNRLPTPSKTRFLDATQQRTIPGMRGMEPTTAWKLLLIWNEAQPAPGFFWRPDTKRWMLCSVRRLHHYQKTVANVEETYTTEDVMPKNIRRGDTLELLPIPNGADTLPKALRRAQSGTLYYRTGVKHTWHQLSPVVRKLQDVVMP